MDRLDELLDQIGKRLSVIEGRSALLPTKAWVLGGVMAGIVTGTMLALAILRFFDGSI